MNDVNLHDDELMNSFLMLECLFRLLKFFHDDSTAENYQKTLAVIDQVQEDYGLFDKLRDFETEKNEPEIKTVKSHHMSNLTGIPFVIENNHKKEIGSLRGVVKDSK